MKLIDININKYFHMIPLWKCPIKLPVEPPVEPPELCTARKALAETRGYVGTCMTLPKVVQERCAQPRSS